MEASVVPNIRLIKESSKSGGFCCTSCQKGEACGLAIWRARGSSWRKTCPWLQGGLNKSSNVFGLGCAVCSMMAVRKPAEVACYLEAGAVSSKNNELGGTAFTTFTVVPSMSGKASRFRRHACSKLHQAAVQDSQSNTPGIALSEFEQTLTDMQRGRSARDMLDATLSDRSLLLCWCISEAVLQKYRAFLREAGAICLMRDCRDGRLLIRFRACRASDLQARLA